MDVWEISVGVAIATFIAAIRLFILTHQSGTGSGLSNTSPLESIEPATTPKPAVGQPAPEPIQDAFGERIDFGFYSSIAGLTYRNHDGSVRQKYLGKCESYATLYLVREPWSRYDPAATFIIRKDGAILGYVPKIFSARIAQDLDVSAGSWICVFLFRDDPPEDGSEYRGATVYLARLKREHWDSHLESMQAIDQPPIVQRIDGLSICTTMKRQIKHKSKL